MVKHHYSMLVIVALVIVCLQMCIFSAHAAASITDADRVAAIHQLNVYKCMHGQGSDNYYTYDTCIQTFTQNWAQSMANANSMTHSGVSYDQTSCSASEGYGENIGAGYSTLSSLLAGFYSEVSKYDWSNPGYSSSTGHFTAMIWKSANLFAAGVAISSDNTAYWSTNYGASGSGTAPNMEGAFDENVTPLSRTQDQCETIVTAYEVSNSTSDDTSSSNILVKYTLTSLTANTSVVVTQFESWISNCGVYSDTLNAIIYPDGNALSQSSKSVELYYVNPTYNATGCAADDFTGNATVSLSVVSTDYPISACAGYNSDYSNQINCKVKSCIVPCKAGVPCLEDDLCPAKKLTCVENSQSAYVCTGSAAVAKIATASIALVSFVIMMVAFGW